MWPQEKQEYPLGCQYQRREQVGVYGKHADQGVANQVSETWAFDASEEVQRREGDKEDHRAIATGLLRVLNINGMDRKQQCGHNSHP